MIRMNHLKNLRVVLAVALISGSLVVVSCNNKSKSETKETDTTKLINADTMPVPDNTNMMDDTTRKDTLKGEQTPPPK
jgi:ABC-type oligopeptide transport system substrate-binding subunit